MYECVKRWWIDADGKTKQPGVMAFPLALYLQQFPNGLGWN
jgi:hypothetical protein